MHPTLILPIAILAVAAIAATFVRARGAAQVSVHEREAAVA